MNFEQAVAEVQQIAGWRTDKATEIRAALQYSQNQREQPGRTYPWFLKSVLTIPTVVGQVAYDIPVNYIQDSDERDGNLFYFLDTVNASRPIFLKKWSRQDLQAKYLGRWPTSDVDPLSDVIEAGKPSDYTLDATQIYLYPIPDAVYNISWACWAKAATLAIGLENAWLANAPWLLIGDAALKICKDLGYKEGQQTATDLLIRAEADLFKAVIHRQEAGRRRSMGSRL